MCLQSKNFPRIATLASFGLMLCIIFDIIYVVYALNVNNQNVDCVGSTMVGNPRREVQVGEIKISTSFVSFKLQYTRDRLQKLIPELGAVFSYATGPWLGPVKVLEIRITWFGIVFIVILPLLILIVPRRQVSREKGAAFLSRALREGP